jgi:hypothetical protein
MCGSGLEGMRIEYPLTVKQLKECYKFYETDKLIGVFRWHGMDLLLPQTLIDDINNGEFDVSRTESTEREPD